MFEEALGGGGGNRTLTAKNPKSQTPDNTDSIGIVSPNAADNCPKILSETIIKNADFSIFSLDVIIESRAEINRYVYEIEKVKTILPHLNIDENFGRPKTYRKTKS